jgi:DNA-binding protein H-NS
MSDEFAKLSDLEILSLIHRANEEIARRKDAHRESLRADIEKKLQGAGLGLADVFPELEGRTQRASKAADRTAGKAVPAKFKSQVSGETWSGRGAHPPQWVKTILSERGWTVEEFKASTEFLA